MRPYLLLLIGVGLGLAAARFLPGAARERASVTASPAAAPPAATHDVPAALHPALASAEDVTTKELLLEVQARLDAIEARLASLDRRPLDGTEGTRADPGRSELRALVADVLSEARAVERERDRADAARDEAEEKERRRAEMRFDIGMMLASLPPDEVVLSPGQKEVVIEAVVDMQERRRELQERLDPLTTDPEAWQHDMESVETSFWQRLEDELGLELAARLRKHF